MKELLPHLPNVQEVVLPGIGHTATFFAVQPEASSRLINTFFDSGKVDDSLYHPETVDSPQRGPSAMSPRFSSHWRWRRRRGGWLLGALIVLATLPSVPVDDELLVALSVGLPVGLGICLA